VLIAFEDYVNWQSGIMNFPGPALTPAWFARISSPGQLEQPHGIILHDARPHLRLDRQLLEIGQPAIRRDDRRISG
jgi:hypothetical protein